MNILSTRNYTPNYQTYQKQAHNSTFGHKALYHQRVDTFIRAMHISSLKKHQEWDPFFDQWTRYLTCINPKTAEPFLVRMLMGRRPSGKVCLFFHGGSSTTPNYQDLYYSLMKNNICVIPVEYFGYDEHNDTEVGYDSLIDSATSIYNHLTNIMHVNPDNISILGYSTGAIPAVNTAARLGCNSLFLVSPVTHMTDFSDAYLQSKNYKHPFLIKLLNKFFKSYPDFLYKLPTTVNLHRDAKKLNCKTYVLSSLQDPVIIPSSTDKFVNMLRQCGIDVSYINGIGGDHKFNPDKIAIITKAMQKNLGTETEKINMALFGRPDDGYQLFNW